jgi:hypothetical protein
MVAGACDHLYRTTIFLMKSRHGVETVRSRYITERHAERSGIGKAVTNTGSAADVIGAVRKVSRSAMPSVTTNTVEARAVETGLPEATTRETAVKAHAMETPVETTLMKVMLMKKFKPEPDR